ncbi:MAG TPA: hypothetical protein VD837_01805 [Terriglobales bacterium]|nr:hypothetical protein [Terriglobales bacterium]
MKRVLPIVVIVLTVVFVAVGTMRMSQSRPNTPEGAVHSLFDHAKARDWAGAFRFVANSKDVNRSDFESELAGRNGSLRTYSSLDKVDTAVLHHNANEALVRTALSYSSAVGPLRDSRDLKVVREGAEWKVVWPVQRQPKVPPQVIPVNYLRWDVVARGENEDWGAQNVDAPKVRITSMNAVEKDGGTVIMGEIVNEDTVPGFVTVNASLVGTDGSVIGEETSFDKMSHTLLPKEISPFRIDFPGIQLKNVKSVRMQPNSMLVSASADPTIGVLHQQLVTDGAKKVLRGELINQSGQTVNIPHVLATYYDNNGKVIWVNDAYVDKALLPMTPQPFEIAVRQDVAPNVQSYRVTVNHYSIARPGQ